MCVIKFCGFTRLDDCLAAVDAGADMLGFNFYPPSPRYISPEECRVLVAELKPHLVNSGRQIGLVGVFVNHSADTIRTILRECNLVLAQCSGDEDINLLAELGNLAFKAVRLGEGSSPDSIVARYPARASAPALLVDGGKAGQYGGTGLTADWSAAAGIATHAPILLAGGLTPANVTEAILQVQPWGVDTASGIESAPGIKDKQKMNDFCQAVLAATERKNA